MITEYWVKIKSFSFSILSGVDDIGNIVYFAKLSQEFSQLCNCNFAFTITYSPGSCFFLPHGARIYNKLMEFIKGQYRERGYQEVNFLYPFIQIYDIQRLPLYFFFSYIRCLWQVLTPNIYNMQLWETSGHAANYKENMFVFEVKFLLFVQVS